MVDTVEGDVMYAITPDCDWPDGRPWKAGQWMYQTGNNWMAVTEAECEGCWFEDGSCQHLHGVDTADWPSPRTYPIATTPPSGTVCFRNADGHAVTLPADELRRIRTLH